MLCFSLVCLAPSERSAVVAGCIQQQRREMVREQHAEAELPGRLGESVSDSPQQCIPWTNPLIPRLGLG